MSVDPQFHLSKTLFSQMKKILQYLSVRYSCRSVCVILKIGNFRAQSMKIQPVSVITDTNPSAWIEIDQTRPDQRHDNNSSVGRLEQEPESCRYNNHNK